MSFTVLVEAIGSALDPAGVFATGGGIAVVTLVTVREKASEPSTFFRTYRQRVGKVNPR
jgi:hypothetical protein